MARGVNRGLIVRGSRNDHAFAGAAGLVAIYRPRCGSSIGPLHSGQRQ
jgi:hypothetical protein